MMNKFSDYSDENLISACKSGDDDAYGVLIGRYLFAVRSRAYAYDKSAIDFEDLVQEGLIGLVNAVKCYDGSFGTSFSTFAYLCIDRNIMSAVKKTFSKKQIPKSVLVFIEETSDFESNNYENPEIALISKENIDLLKKRITDKLSNLEKNVLTLYLNGNSYDKIAKILNISQKSVDNAIQRLRKKLK